LPARHRVVAAGAGPCPAGASSRRRAQNPPESPDREDPVLRPGTLATGVPGSLVGVIIRRDQRS